jgi:hypothetical protein
LVPEAVENGRLAPSTQRHVLRRALGQRLGRYGATLSVDANQTAVDLIQDHKIALARDGKAHRRFGITLLGSFAAERFLAASPKSRHGEWPLLLKRRLVGGVADC